MLSQNYHKTKKRKFILMHFTLLDTLITNDLQFLYLFAGSSVQKHRLTRDCFA